MELLTKELNKLFERSRFVYSVFSIFIYLILASKIFLSKIKKSVRTLESTAHFLV